MNTFKGNVFFPPNTAIYFFFIMEYLVQPIVQEQNEEIKELGEHHYC